MMNVGKKLLNHREVCAQECTYRALGLPLTKTSRHVVFDDRRRFNDFKALVDAAVRDPKLHYKVAIVGNSHVRDLALLPFDDTTPKLALLANRLCSIGYFGVGGGGGVGGLNPCATQVGKDKQADIDNVTEQLRKYRPNWILKMTADNTPTHRTVQDESKNPCPVLKQLPFILLLGDDFPDALKTVIGPLPRRHVSWRNNQAVLYERRRETLHQEMAALVQDQVLPVQAYCHTDPTRYLPYLKSDGVHLTTEGLYILRQQIESFVFRQLQFPAAQVPPTPRYEGALCRCRRPLCCNACLQCPVCKH